MSPRPRNPSFAIEKDCSATCLNFDERETDLKRVVDTFHGGGLEGADSLLEPFAIYGSNLVEDNGRAKRKSALRLLDNYVRWVGRGIESRTDRRHDGDRAIAVADVVLNDQSRSGLLNLMAPSRIE